MAARNGPAQAPKSSASYWPELPLRAPASSQTAGQRLHPGPLGGGPGAAGLEGERALLPSIDYAEYFANFDSRPLEQHLKLSLKLDKKHFLVSSQAYHSFMGPAGGVRPAISTNILHMSPNTQTRTQNDVAHRNGPASRRPTRN